MATLIAPIASRAATTGTVQGVVRDDTGKPAQGANVFLVGTGLQTKTGPNGYYTFTGVNPGAYTVRVELVTFTTATQPATVQQDFTTVLDFSLVKRSISGGRTIVIAPTVQRTTTTTATTISAKVEQETKSQPNNLYQFPGLVFGQPGITPDAGGYVHIRGSDINQVGFDVDGIQVTEPMTNTFATNLVTVGLKSANLYTGGADASYGNATGGFINEVTNNGRDLRGGIVEYTNGPGHGWNYSGTNTQYGNVSPDGKFDYYASTIAFKNGFPSGLNGLDKLNASFDGVLKANYYADPNNTITAFYSQGFEQYNNYDPGGSAATSPYKFDEHLGTTVDTPTQYQQDHDDQGYNFSYLSYKHNFDPKSFLTYRLYRVRSEVTFHLENLGGVYQNRHSDQVGNQIDYANQLKQNDTVRAGFAIVPSTTKYRSVSLISGAAPVLPIDQVPAYGYNDRTSRVSPTQYVGYLTNQFRTTDSKITLDTGVRFAAQRYGLKEFSTFTKHYVDPRVGLNYSPSRDLVFRSSFAESSQFADTRLIELLFPEDPASGIGTFTALNPGNPADYIGLDPNQLTSAQRGTQYGQLLRRYAQLNEIGPQHSHNFDLGVEKSFSVGAPVVGGNYALSLTGFRHQQYDLIQLNRTFFVDPGDANGNPLVAGGVVGIQDGQRSYNATGKGHASGLEVVFSRRPRNTNDLSGFVTYTNQIAKATSSSFDTGYNPYFYNTFAGLGPTLGLNDAQFRALNNVAYPTSYDQRHTVAVVVNKRFTKLLEESVVLDAGSGFPFVAAIGGGVDPQRAAQGFGGATFGEVPIVLPDQSTLAALNPVPGRSGWHYKFSFNTNFNLTPETSLFLNVDNPFDRKTVLSYSTADTAGNPYYIAPTAAFPQGKVYYGPSTILTPVFLTVGFRHKF